MNLRLFLSENAIFQFLRSDLIHATSWLLTWLVERVRSQNHIKMFHLFQYFPQKYSFSKIFHCACFCEISLWNERIFVRNTFFIWNLFHITTSWLFNLTSRGSYATKSTSKCYILSGIFRKNIHFQKFWRESESWWNKLNLGFADEILNVTRFHDFLTKVEISKLTRQSWKGQESIKILFLARKLDLESFESRNLIRIFPKSRISKFHKVQSSGISQSPENDSSPIISNSLNWFYSYFMSSKYFQLNKLILLLFLAAKNRQLKKLILLLFFLKKI